LQVDDLIRALNWNYNYKGVWAVLLRTQKELKGYRILMVDVSHIIIPRTVAIVLIGLTASILSGLLGIGGGAILIPALTCLLGFNQHRAHGTSLAVMGPVVLFTALYYASHGNVDWPAAIELAAGGVVGASIGARFACRLSAVHLRRYFGILLVVISLKMMYDFAAAYMAVAPQVSHLPVIAPSSFAGGLAMFFIGVGVGVMSGIFGVGGGIIMIPVLVLLLGYPQILAQGISLAVIIPVSISGALIHARHGNVNFGVAVWLIAGGIAGGLLGARLALGLNQDILRGLFSLLMMGIGISTIRSSGTAREIEYD
jgi:uncharacterized membrane protein YfcA